MLVLTRRVGEDIVIDGALMGGPIRVKIVAVRGRTVRLGITAPDSVRVDRSEIHDRRCEVLAPLGKENLCESIK